MVSKYNATIDNKIIKENLHRLIGQVYKLLPYREEGVDWEKPLQTIQEELAGMQSLFADYEDYAKILFSLECKLEGLLSDQSKNDFDLFRRTIFECIGKIKALQNVCLDTTI